MADDVNANIRVNLDTSQALAGLQSLQSRISAFNQSVIQSNSQAVAAQRGLLNNFQSQIGASRQFSTSITNVETSVGRLQTAIDKNRLSMGQYFRYGVASSKNFGRVFRQENEQITRLATERVRRLQTQYIALGESQQGMTRALQVRPLQLFNADAAVAIQKSQMFNKLLQDGSTSLVNWGKNTQWAGRQLMVGFTVPLTIFGGMAGKIFMELEEQAINFRKVYGDIFTSEAEVEENLAAVRELTKEMAKYGIAARDTFELANIAAQAGFRGADLMAQTEEATRLAVLGQMEQAEAMRTTITLQNAFQLSNEDLADSINFLNIVENQSVLSLQDVSGAIPRVAPVIKSLGGDVRDLSVMLVAMREGGVTAAEGANALKTSLARLISPTTRAIGMAKDLGINLNAIVEGNQGDILAAVMELARSMEALDELSQQRLLSEIFGKRQYARVGALFNNITNEASQAQRVLDLTAMSTEDLAATAEKELGAVEQSIATKFTAAIETLKIEIAPIGEQFLKLATPIIEGATKIFERFNSLSPTVKNFIAILTAGVGVVVPVVLMLVGLFGNLLGNLIKGFATISGFFSRLRNGAEAVDYLSGSQLEAAAAAASLEGQVNGLTGSLNIQREAVDALASAYNRYVAGANAAASNLPQGFRTPASRPPQAFARGGMVAGMGNSDNQPALLTPGEFVMNKEATQRFGPVLDAMNRGTVKGFQEGSRLAETGFGVFQAQSTRSASAVTDLLSKIVNVSEQQRSNIVSALQRLETENQLTRKALQLELDQIGVSLQQLPDGMARAHVFEQSRGSVSPSMARQMVAQSGSQITAPGFLNFLQQAESMPQGSFNILPRSDLIVDLPKQINEGLKRGIASTDFADALEAGGVDKWSKTVKLAGVSAEDAAPQFDLFDRKMQELARSSDLVIADFDDAERGIVSFGTLSRQAMEELEGQVPLVSQTFDTLEGRFRTFQVSLNQDMIPTLERLGFTIERISRQGEELFRISGGTLGAPLEVRTRAQRESARGSYRGVKDAPSLAEFTEYGTTVGRTTGQAAIRGLEIGTESNSESRAAQRVADDTVDGFANQLKRGTDDVQSAARGLGDAATNAIAGQTSDIRKLLKERLNVGPIVEQEQAQLRESIALEKKLNREIEKRMLILSSRGASGFGLRERAMAELAAERAAAAAPPPPPPTPSILPTTLPQLQVAPQEIQNQLNRVVQESKKMSEQTSLSARAMSKIKGEATRFGGALKNGSMKMQGAFFALDGLVFAASMMNNSFGEIAQKALPVIFGLQGLTMVLPLLMTPLGLMAAAAGAAIAGLYLVKKRSDDIAKEGNKLANALNAATSDVEGFAEFYGRESIVQKQEAEKFGTTTEELTRAEEFLQTNFGKTISEGLASAIDSYGVSTSAKQFANKLGSMVLQGVVTEEEAKNIANALSNQLGITGFDLRVNGELERLIGPTGEDVLQNGIDIAVRLREEGQRNVSGMQDVITNALETAQAAIEADENLRNLIAIVNAAPEELKVGPIPLDWIQGMAEDFAMSSEEVAEAKKQVVAFGTTISGVVSSQYANLASAQIAYNKSLEEANKIEDPKKRSQALNALKEQEKQLRKLEKQTDKNVRQSVDFFEQQQSIVQQWMTEGVRMNIQTIYEGTPQQMFVDSVLGRTGKLEDQSVAFTIEVGMASGQLNPSVVEEIFKIIGNDETASAKIALAVETAGVDDANRLFSGIATLQDEDLRAELSLQAPDLGAGGIEAVANALEYIQTLPDNVQKTLTAETFGTNEALEINRILLGFDALPDNASKKRYADFFENNFDNVYFDMSWFKDLPDETKKQFVATFSIYFNEFGKLTGAGLAALREAYPGMDFSQLPGGATGPAAADLLSDSLVTATTTTEEETTGEDGTTEDTDGGGGGDESFLEGLMNTLKANAKLFNTAEGATKKYISARGKFFGMLEQLRKEGIPAGIIAMIGTGTEGVANARELLDATAKERRELLKYYGRVVAGEAADEIRVQTTEAQIEVDALRSIQSGGLSQNLQEFIMGSEKLKLAFAGVKEGGKQYRELVKLAEELLALEEERDRLAQSTSDKLKDQADLNNRSRQILLDSIDLEMAKNRNDLYEEFAQKMGITPEMLQKTINLRENEIEKLERQVETYDEIIEAEQERIESIQNQIDAKERQIAQYERQNELDERQIETLNRQDELRNRVADALNRELQQMSDAEQKIRDSYQQRIDALDKVASVNDHIINQQRQQLGLSQAIAEGDIYAATAAIQEMRASSAGFAAEQVRAGLEAGMQNQVAGLRTAGGLTREQAEQQIRNIEEQSYQTSLAIRDIEDRIYNRNLQMIPLKDEIYNLNESIYAIEQEIRKQEELKKQFIEGQIEPLQLTNEIQSRMLADLEYEVDERNGPLAAKRDHMQRHFDISRDQENINHNLWLQTEAIADGTAKARDRASELAKNYGDVARNALAAAAAIASISGGATVNAYAGGMIDGYGMGGKIKKYRGGGVVSGMQALGVGGVAGDGSRDSVMAMLTPGEFVVRKAMVEKYGLPLMEALNQGSFYMPTYDTGRQPAQVEAVGGGMVSNINAPVYNTYDMKFSINGANQSADEIANKVMFKMKQLQSQGVRSNRGY